MSVARVVLGEEANGVATGWKADVAATAKRTLKAGEMLDGEGVYTVWGKLLPARTFLQRRALPLGLAHQVNVIRDVSEGDTVT